MPTVRDHSARYRVVCDDYAIPCRSLAAAVATLAMVGQLGACRLDHVVEARDGDGVWLPLDATRAAS